MNKQRKIYVVGAGGSHYINWMEGQLEKNIENADLVVFTGGEDVSPDFYGHPVHKTTQYNKARDLYEKKMFDLARSLNKPCLGICRGSQFACVMSGGVLVQNQPNPYFKHMIKTYDNLELEITSTHHQAAFPYEMPKDHYKLLGWTENLLRFHVDGNDEEMNPEKEAEIVFYPKTNFLGIQGHPEMLDVNSETIVYLRGLLNKFLTQNI